MQSLTDAACCFQVKENYLGTAVSICEMFILNFHPSLPTTIIMTRTSACSTVTCLE